MGFCVRRCIGITAAGLFGLTVGCVSSMVHYIQPRQFDYPFLAEQVPLPHHVPEHAGGAAFRFAMVHDVIHERFSRHGAAWYRERNRLTQEKLAGLSPDDPASFPLADDLAAGLERLGQSDEAVGIMRDKLARQLAWGLQDRELYTSYANLGTFLIHANFKKAMAGDREARARFDEGVQFVRQSVKVNPEAHFGRERWQTAIAEFIRAVMDKPDLLQEFDCLGNRLDLDIEAALNREGNWVFTGYGRPTDAAFSQGRVENDLPAFFRPGVQPENPSMWPELNPIRKHITKVGAEQKWEEVSVPSHREPAPFDEPMLGMIGMWRQGGGANPHFALAFGESMLRVGQRYIAWTAYERAYRLADRYSADPALQEFLRRHCRKRQTEIEETLLHQNPPGRSPPAWQHISPPPAPDEVAGFRARFEAELAHGEAFQKAYQEYETARITAGASIADEHFFDEFHADRQPISSAVGSEEWFAYVPRWKAAVFHEKRKWAWGVFGAGLAALAAALIMRRRAT